VKQLLRSVPTEVAALELMDREASACQISWVIFRFNRKPWFSVGEFINSRDSWQQIQSKCMLACLANSWSLSASYSYITICIILNRRHFGESCCRTKAPHHTVLNAVWKGTLLGQPAFWIVAGEPAVSRFDANKDGSTIGALRCIAKPVVLQFCHSMKYYPHWNANFFHGWIPFKKVMPFCDDISRQRLNQPNFRSQISSIKMLALTMKGDNHPSGSNSLAIWDKTSRLV